MAEPTKTGPVKDAKGRITMTAADAAKLVKRMVAKIDPKTGKVVLDANNNPVAVEQDVRADEVMSFAEYTDKVVVVTTSGEKLEAAK